MSGKYTDRVIILGRIQRAIELHTEKLKQEHPNFRDDFLRGMEAIQYVVEEYYDEEDDKS